MDPNNILDAPGVIGYNNDNDEDVIVKMDEVHPINDLECQHETLIRDPSDMLGNAVYHGCANLKCGRGWYIPIK